MLTMSQINHIKDLSNCGYRISEISKKTGADPKTIRKYLAQDDFSRYPGEAIQAGSLQAHHPGVAGRRQETLAKAAPYRSESL